MMLQSHKTTTAMTKCKMQAFLMQCFSQGQVIFTENSACRERSGIALVSKTFQFNSSTVKQPQDSWTEVGAAARARESRSTRDLLNTVESRALAQLLARSRWIVTGAEEKRLSFIDLGTCEFSSVCLPLSLLLTRLQLTQFCERAKMRVAVPSPSASL